MALGGATALGGAHGCNMRGSFVARMYALYRNYTCSFILLRVGGHIASQCHIDKHRCAPFSWRCRPPLCRCHGHKQKFLRAQKFLLVPTTISGYIRIERMDADDESSWSSCCEKVRLLALGHCSWDASISLQLLTAQVNDVVRSLGDSEAQRDQRGWANAETCWVGAADGCWFASHCAVSMLRSTDALGTLLPCKQPSSLCLQPLSAQQNPPKCLQLQILITSTKFFGWVMNRIGSTWDVLVILEPHDLR